MADEAGAASTLAIGAGAALDDDAFGVGAIDATLDALDAIVASGGAARGGSDVAHAVRTSAKIDGRTRMHRA